jgi:YVTN family beta-propeller protein
VARIEPEGVAINPNRQWAYVTAATSNSVSVIDTEKDSVVSNFQVDVGPSAVAWAPDGARVYASSGIGGTATMIDERTHALISPVRTGAASAKRSLATARALRQRLGVRCESGGKRFRRCEAHEDVGS